MKRTIAILIAVCLVTVALPVVALQHEAKPPLEERADFIVQGNITGATPHTSAHTTWSASGAVDGPDGFHFEIPWTLDDNDPHEGFSAEGQEFGGINAIGPGIEQVSPGDSIGTSTTWGPHDRMLKAIQHGLAEGCQEAEDRAEGTADEEVNQACRDARNETANASQALQDEWPTVQDALGPEVYTAIEIYFWSQEDDDAPIQYISGCFAEDLQDGDQRDCIIPQDTRYVEITALYGHDLVVTVALEEPVIVLEEEDIECTDQACTLDASGSYTTIGEIDGFKWVNGAEVLGDYKDDPSPTIGLDELDTNEVTLVVENDEGVVASKTVTLDA